MSLLPFLYFLEPVDIMFRVIQISFDLPIYEKYRANFTLNALGMS